MGLKNKDLFSKCSPVILRINAYNKNGVCTKHGSAVVLKKKGIIITNYHNIFQSSYFKLFLGNKEVEHDGILIIDKDLDILLLKIKDSKSFPDLAFNTEYAVGDDIFTIGNPLNNNNSFTKGMINGINRFVECIEYPFGIRRKNLIQFDAGLSKGNSGGGLLNTKGELIGITTLTDQSGQKFNYAVPMEDVLNLLKRAPKVTGHKDKKLEEELLRFHMNLINGDEDQALVHINNCLKIKKDEEYFLFSKIILLNNLDGGDEAIEVCNKILLNTPKNEEVSFLIFLALFNQLRFNEALQVLEKSFSNQNDYLILCFKGNIYTLLTDYKKAFTCFQKAIAKDDKEIAAYLGLATYYILKKQFSEAENIAKKLYSEHSELLITSYLMGEIYFFKEKYKESLDFLEEFLYKADGKIKLRLETENVTMEEHMNSLIMSKAIDLKITNMSKLNRLDEALNEIDNLINCYPNNYFYYLTRSHIYVIKNQIKNAFEDINTSIKLNLNNNIAYIVLGGLYYDENKFEEANKAFGVVLKSMPNLIDVLFMKAFSLIQLKRFKEAIKIKSRIVKINNDIYYSDLIMAMFYEEKKDWKKSLIYTKKLYQRYPENNFYSIAYAYSLNMNKRTKEALVLIDKILKIEESFYALIVKALILCEMKDYRESIALCNYAKENFENNNKIAESYFYFARGKSHLKLNNYTNGTSDLENAKVFNPKIEKEVNKLLKGVYKIH